MLALITEVWLFTIVEMVVSLTRMPLAVKWSMMCWLGSFS